MREKPELTFDTIKGMEDMTWFTHAKIFDDLLIVAQKETSCYIWRTSEGLVIIDGIWPDKAVYDAILTAIEEEGWNHLNINKFIITHGHIDHVGCGKWLIKNHKTKTYLSKLDDELRLSQPTEEGKSDSWKEFDIDFYVKDGDIIDCGDKSIMVVGTPGHTKGCMSYLFPVFDNGEKHIAALFGGATPPWNDTKGREVQKESIKKFIDISKQNHADVILTNHTAFDSGLERISYSKKRMTYMPNIYVLSEEGFDKFCSVYRKVTE